MDDETASVNGREVIALFIGVYSLPCLSSRYMGRRFMRAVDRTSQAGLSAFRELYAPAFSKFSVPDPKSQGVHESDWDSLYYPHIIQRHLGLRYPAKKG